MSIRRAEEKDYPAVLDILNQAIKERRYTALLTPATLSSREKWFKEHSDQRHPIFVYEKDNSILGWMAVSAYRDGREGFMNTCEISYYIDENERNKGIATKLLEHTLEFSKKNNIKNLMAVVFIDNQASRKLIEKFGFEIWGRFPDIVEIDDCHKDCLQYGRKVKKD